MSLVTASFLAAISFVCKFFWGDALSLGVGMVVLSRIIFQNITALADKVTVLGFCRFGIARKLLCTLFGSLLVWSVLVSQNEAVAAVSDHNGVALNKQAIFKTRPEPGESVFNLLSSGRFEVGERIQVADASFGSVGGRFDNFGQAWRKSRKRRYYKSKNIKVKPKYNLGGKLPKKGYVKSYKYGNGIDFDDADLDYYRAPKRNKRYQRQVKTTYRTMCVRLRDGYYWPISFAQTKQGLKKDQAKCQKSCSDDVRLFYYPSVSTDEALSNMRDLKGQRYSSLKTAFLYRTKYVKEASCKPKPWSAEAKAEHAVYAAKDGEKKRLMHLAAIKKAERKRVAILKGKARRLARKKRRYSKKRLRKHRRVARVYRRKKRYRR